MVLEKEGARRHEREHQNAGCSSVLGHQFVVGTVDPTKCWESATEAYSRVESLIEEEERKSRKSYLLCSSN